jgi:hypothetical protein
VPQITLVISDDVYKVFRETVSQRYNGKKGSVSKAAQEGFLLFVLQENAEEVVKQHALSLGVRSMKATREPSIDHPTMSEVAVALNEMDEKQKTNPIDPPKTTQSIAKKGHTPEIQVWLSTMKGHSYDELVSQCAKLVEEGDDESIEKYEALNEFIRTTFNISIDAKSV